MNECTYPRSSRKKQLGKEKKVEECTEHDGVVRDETSVKETVMRMKQITGHYRYME